MPADIKITTEILYRGMLLFGFIDAIYVPLLIWRVDEETFRRLKWFLVISAAAIWYGIWIWAIGNFWETVYTYVFPAWAQIWLPRIAFVAAGLTAFILWNLALLTKGKAVLTFCLLGGVLGTLTHIWAVYRGVVSKPPMLQGASPLAAVIFAFFEYILYWCSILAVAKVLDWMYSKLARMQITHSRLVGG